MIGFYIVWINYSRADYFKNFKYLPISYDAGIYARTQSQLKPVYYYYIQSSNIPLYLMYFSLYY